MTFQIGFLHKQGEKYLCNKT